MSTIDEIRKRAAMPWDSPDAPSQYQLLMDVKTLLAALDGEWQSEPPSDGDAWCAPHPSRRKLDLGLHAVTIRSGAVWMDGEYVCRVDHPDLVGALWQRRTVPADPFKKETNHE